MSIELNLAIFLKTKDFYEGCGKENFCFAHSDICLNQKDCEFAVKIRKDHAKDHFVVTQILTRSQPSIYIANGIGEKSTMVSTKLLSIKVYTISERLAFNCIFDRLT